MPWCDGGVRARHLLEAAVLEQLDLDSLPGIRSIAMSSSVASGTPTISGIARSSQSRRHSELEPEQAAVEARANDRVGDGDPRRGGRR